MNVFTTIIGLLPWIDWLPDWEGGIERPSLEEIRQCGEDRCKADDIEDPAKPGKPPIVYPVFDVEHRAATTIYGHNGKNKRTRYPRVDLKSRIVVIGLHQAGVERSSRRWEQSAHRVTCHRAIGPDGTRFKVHPLNTRLVCTNRLDRKPYHCIGIELLGNFEGVEGSGNWYKPTVFGRGVLGTAQAEAARQEVAAIVDEVTETWGARVDWIVPHRTVGRGENGRPNRQLCCGSAGWSRVGEWAGRHLDLAVPGRTWKLGGLSVPDEWHGPHYASCRRLIE